MDLTFYQAELFTHGRYFKNILQNSKNTPPDDIMNDPDKIIEWYEASTNAQEAMNKINKDSSGGSSIVGASREEMQKLGAIDDSERGIDLAAEAAKKGGELTMDDLIKLHGQ
jgi:precorrin-4 methylase